MDGCGDERRGRCSSPGDGDDDLAEPLPATQGRLVEPADGRHACADVSGIGPSVRLSLPVVLIRPFSGGVIRVRKRYPTARDSAVCAHFSFSL
jgi:hypothetical protein